MGSGTFTKVKAHSLPAIVTFADLYPQQVGSLQDAENFLFLLFIGLI